MRTLLPVFLLISIFLLISSGLFADTVTFQDGRSVNGSYLGGDARTVRVAVGDRVETYSVSDVRNITFGSAAQSSAPPQPNVVPPPVYRERPVPPQPTATAARMSSGEIPTGTVLTVRLIDDVDSQRDRMGQTYRASLDEPVLDGAGNTVVTRGADVVIKLVDDKESGKIEGKTILTLDVVSLNINGRPVEIDTANVSQESESRTGRSAKVIGGTAVLGTIIGAIAGGGKGAAIGAASGAGVGTAAQVLTKGQRVRIPSETRLTFTLQQPVRI